MKSSSFSRAIIPVILLVYAVNGMPFPQNNMNTLCSGCVKCLGGMQVKLPSHVWWNYCHVDCHSYSYLQQIEFLYREVHKQEGQKDKCYNTCFHCQSLIRRSCRNVAPLEEHYLKLHYKGLFEKLPDTTSSTRPSTTSSTRPITTSSTHPITTSSTSSTTPRSTSTTITKSVIKFPVVTKRISRPRIRRESDAVSCLISKTVESHCCHNSCPITSPWNTSEMWYPVWFDDYHSPSCQHYERVSCSGSCHSQHLLRPMLVSTAEPDIGTGHFFKLFSNYWPYGNQLHFMHVEKEGYCQMHST